MSPIYREIVPCASAAALVVAAGYHTMGPRSQLYGRTFTAGPRSRRLALTFDDGPCDPFTPQLLDILAKHNVRATFFMIGANVARRPDIARAVAAAGHAIGNHTQNHPLLIFKSRTAFRSEVEQCHSALRDAIGDSARLFRPPYGGRRPAILRETRALGYEPVMWSVAGYDWQTQSPAVIAGNIRSRVRGGEVVLLHDGSPLCNGRSGKDRSGTVAATARLIVDYQSEGFEFVTIPEMMTASAS
ncbi:MAG TPA: polysaccharide deacetylase family protein [Terriglobales bacterium]|nr:polysaccharide deacetylase family protein [Terriglobales bacterium]